MKIRNAKRKHADNACFSVALMDKRQKTCCNISIKAQASALILSKEERMNIKKLRYFLFTYQPKNFWLIRPRTKRTLKKVSALYLIIITFAFLRGYLDVMWNGTSVGYFGQIALTNWTGLLVCLYLGFTIIWAMARIRGKTNKFLVSFLALANVTVGGLFLVASPILTALAWELLFNISFGVFAV